MKKLLTIAVVIALTTVSCKKDHTCTCTSSSSAGGSTDTQTTTLVGSTKSQAKANCVTTKYTTSSGATITNDCKLS